MILIADSGSTKTSWALISGDKTIINDTRGFNPYYMQSEVLQEILEKELTDELKKADVKEIYFYGSGCSTDKNCAVVSNALRSQFKNAGIEVNHDLLAAARALLGRSEGIACILGTGANSCAYDGKNITANIPSLGYMFGDEGSGAYIGRKFLIALLKKQLTRGILDDFEKEHGLSLEDILRSTYNEGNPGGFMASFMPFMAKHEHHDDIREILFSSFMDFFKESVSKYPKYKQVPVSFAGSVAFHFRHILNEAAWQSEISIGRIEKAPMDGLIRFHSE